VNSHYQKTVFPDGMRIISESIPSVRSISIGLWIDIGSRDEPQDIEGVSHFIEHMVFKGTTTRSAFDIVSYIESVGGILNAFTTRENTCFLSKIIDLHLPRAVEILSDMVLNARFDEGDIAKEKKIVIEEINEVDDTPSDLVHDIFADSIFGKHSLGRPILGTVESVQGYSPEKVVGFLKNNYQRDRMLVVASGNLEHEKLAELVGKYFPDTNSGDYVSKSIKRMKPKLHSGILAVNRDIKQAHICIGMPAVTFDHSQRAALLLLNSILGGSMSSRLFQIIREEMGMAYTVFSYLDFFVDSSIIGVYLNTEKEQTGAVISAVFKELEKFKKNSLSSIELDSAKEQFKGSLVLGLENTSHRMNRLAKHELFLNKYISIDETIKEIDKVASTDLLNLANQLFHADKFNVTVLGPVSQSDVENSISW